MRAGSMVATPRYSEVIPVLARWVLGGIFIYMGLAKALHPVDFLKLVRAYEMPLAPLVLNAIAAGLPWFELFCGCLLVAGIAVKGTALATLSMLVPFTLAILKRAFAITTLQHISFFEVKFDCGCGNGEVYIWKKMIENGLLTVATMIVLLATSRQFCLKFSFFERVGPRAEVEKASEISTTDGTSSTVRR